MFFQKRLRHLIGNLLIVGGVLLLSFTFFPVLLQEGKYQTSKFKPQEYQVLESPQQATQTPTLVSQKKIITPISFEFSLVVPKIGVNAQVFPNIDSGNEKEYLPVLKKGVAHAKGSRLPNERGVVFIFAHSTDSFLNLPHYNAVFFLLNKLQAGDEVFLFYQNQKYQYQVTEKKIIDPEMVGPEVKSILGNALVLQTCYPPGTTLKRLLIIARP